MNKQEFNKQEEFTPTNEFRNIRDNAVVAESAMYKENEMQTEIPEDVGIKPKLNEKKKQQALGVMTGSLVTVVASAVVGMTSLLNVQMKAEFADVTYSDGLISYQVNVSGMSEKESLMAYLYENDILVAKIDLVDEDKDGVINGSYQCDNTSIAARLAESKNVSINYSFTLKGNVGLNVERAFDNYAIKIDKVTSEFADVDYWCNCGVDGYYYFQMNFKDDLGLFTNFKASIVDSFGNEAFCTFSDDLHEAQKIYVLDLKGAGGILTISYDAEGVNQVITQTVRF